jgi:hypothetical protein
MGGVMVPMELTSTWIPLSILGMLCVYMIMLFRQERAETRAYEAELAAGGGAVAVSPDISSGLAGDVAHVQPATSHTHEANSAAAAAPTKTKRKRSLTWNTAYLWLPFVAGFAGQAYLDFLKAMIDKVAN